MAAALSPRPLNMQKVSAALAYTAERESMAMRITRAAEDLYPLPSHRPLMCPVTSSAGRPPNPAILIPRRVSHFPAAWPAYP